jgi:hypothetical protein
MHLLLDISADNFHYVYNYASEERFMTYQGHGLPPHSWALSGPEFSVSPRLPSLLLSPPLRLR